MLYTGYVGFSMAYAFAIAALIEGRVDASLGALGAALDAGCLVRSDVRHRAWQLLGLLRARLGRLVVLGPGRERVLHALAGGDRAAPFGARGREAREPQELDHPARDPGLLPEPARHLPGALGRPDLGPRLRRRPQARRLHPGTAGDRDRRLARPLRLARRRQLQAGGLFAPGLAARAALVLNNLLLATACATVFLGTLYPLLLETLGGAKISVGPPYFDATFAPLMVPLLGRGAGRRHARLEAGRSRGRARPAQGSARDHRGGRDRTAGDHPRQRHPGGRRHGARGLGRGGLAARARGPGAALAPAAQAELAAGHGPAALRLQHDPRPHRGRRAGRRRDRVERLARRGDPGHAAGRHHDARRLQLQARRHRRPPGPELRRQARDLRGHPRRPPGRDPLSRAALLPGRAPVDLGGRDRHRLLARPLRGPGRSGQGRQGRRRRPRGPDLLQSAGDVDLGRHRDHGPGRALVAHRSPPSGRRARRAPAPAWPRPPRGPDRR